MHFIIPVLRFQYHFLIFHDTFFVGVFSIREKVKNHLHTDNEIAETEIYPAIATGEDPQFCRLTAELVTPVKAAVQNS